MSKNLSSDQMPDPKALTEIRGDAESRPADRPAREGVPDLSHLGRERFKILTSATFEGLVIIEDGRIAECNEQLAAILGYSIEELVGQNAETFVIPEERERVIDTVRRRTDANLEVKVVRKDGRVITVETRGRSILYKGQFARIAAIREVTGRDETKRALHLPETELSQLSRLHTMGQVAFGLAHELNQPLSSILNYAVGVIETLNCNPETAGPILPALQVIQKEAERAGGIIRRLRVIAARKQPKQSLVDLKSLVLDVMRLMQLQLHHAGVTTHIESPEPAPQVTTDSVQIMQVLINLVRNAVDAMTSGGETGKELTIALSIEGDFARVEVSDQGCGIPPERMKQLFNPFFTTKPDGLGMGLSISQTLIQNLGGELTATGNPAGGMTFAFTCPLDGR